MTVVFYLRFSVLFFFCRDSKRKKFAIALVNKIQRENSLVWSIYGKSVDHKLIIKSDGKII